MNSDNWEVPDYIFTVIRRTEETLRAYISRRMRDVYGDSWVDRLPGELRRTGKDLADPLENMASTDEIWHQSYFRHLSETIMRNWQNVFREAIDSASKNDVQVRLEAINKIRQRAYHAKPVYESDLRQVITEAVYVAHYMGESAQELALFLDGFWRDKQDNINKMPENKRDTNGELFVNVPEDDFELIGRRNEMRDLEQWLRGRDAVVTIAGRGGVGKTAVAIKLVHKLWDVPTSERLFKAVIWVTGKNSRLTNIGIEEFEAELTTYEQLIETLCTVLEGDDLEDLTLEELEEHVSILLSLHDFPILIVVDNLETISEDYRIIEFIKQIPHPSKVLVTSRIGIGEIEHRLQLTGLNETDARTLARITARETSGELTDAILRLDDASLTNWLDPVDGVAVAIKWMVAQIALGKSFESVRAVAGSNESELVEFLFRDVYSLLAESARTMMCVLSIFNANAPTDELWRMVSGLDQDEFEDGKRQLALASMISHSIDDGTSRYRLAGLSEAFAIAEFEQLDAVKTLARQRYRRFTQAVNTAAQVTDTRHRNYRALRALRTARNEEETVAAVYTEEAYELWERNQDIVGARAKFEEALSVLPGFYFALKTWADVEDKAGNFENSERLMNDVLVQHSDNPDVYIDMANIMRYSQSRPPQQRISNLLSKAYELSPTDVRIVHMYADSERRRGAFERAESLLANSEISFPRDSDSRRALRWFLARIELYNSWARDLTERRKFEEALSKLDKAQGYITQAMGQWPSELDILSAQKTNKLQRGVAYARSGNPRLAFAEYEGALWDKSVLTNAENAHNSRVELARARTFRNRHIGDISSARTAAEKGLSYAKDSGNARLISQLSEFINDL